MTEVMQVRELSQQRAWHRMNPTPDIESLLKQALADPNAFPVTYRESIHGQAQRSHYCHTRQITYLNHTHAARAVLEVWCLLR
jgi:hypothetical protein